MTQDNEDIDIEFPQASPDRLQAHNRRQLSAMLDGELSPDQARFMLRRLQHDAELAACWERWQVCGDVLRGRGHALLPADFSSRVMAAVAGPGDAAPEGTAGNTTAAGEGARPQHRLLRWGGGALAASVALVALFMARQLPDPQAQGQLEAASAMRAAPALVESVATAAPADAGEDRPSLAGAPLPAPGPQDTGSVLPALMAAAPAAMAVAELPRRAGERGSTRSQSQRAALRRAQAGAEAPVRVAVSAAPRPPIAAAVQAPADSDAALPALAGMPADTGGSESLFGALPPAATRPWPRAVLPGITRSQPFAAGYGLPQGEAFAPFQPRLESSTSAQAPGLAGRGEADGSAVPAGPETDSIR